MTLPGFPWLTALWMLPTLAGAALLLLPSAPRRPRQLALAGGVALTALAALLLLAYGIGGPRVQFVESRPWVTSLGLGYTLGADALALVLALVLGGLMLASALLARDLTAADGARLLLLAGGVAGALVAQDLALAAGFCCAAIAAGVAGAGVAPNASDERAPIMADDDADYLVADRSELRPDAPSTADDVATIDADMADDVGTGRSSLHPYAAALDIGTLAAAAGFGLLLTGAAMLWADGPHTFDLPRLGQSVLLGAQTQSAAFWLLTVGALALLGSRLAFERALAPLVLLAGYLAVRAAATLPGGSPLRVGPNSGWLYALVIGAVGIGALAWLVVAERRATRGIDVSAE